MTRNSHRSQFVVVIVSIILLSSFFAGTAVAAVTITGEFNATFGGYNDESTDGLDPNEIQIAGDFTVEGENANNIRVVIRPSQYTVLDTDSVEVFVEGDQSAEFETEARPGEIHLVTDQVEAGTTIQVSFSTYYTGGTDDDEIEAGSVTVNYETAGGSEDDKTFSVNTDATSSADNQIAALESDIGTQQYIQILAGIGAFAIVIGVVGGGYWIWKRRQSPY